jgi:hypothetical protein
MKKQTLILFSVIASIVFVSCHKQDLSPNDAATKAPVEQADASVAGLERTINPLLVGLDGWFTFNGHLKDQMNKLPNGTSTGRGVLYTYDRKGNPKAAVKFNGTYGINLTKVPQPMKATVAAWVKMDNPNVGTGRMIVRPKFTGLGLGKWKSEVHGSISLTTGTSMGIDGGNQDLNWHHLAVSFDATTLRMYVDGQLVNSQPCSFLYLTTLQDYRIGYWPTPEWFEGSVDDLRFYSRTLSASEIQALAAL